MSETRNWADWHVRDRLNYEQKWAIVWGVLVGAVIAAEVYAIRTGDPRAPLSHHVRRHTRIMGKSPLGRAMLFVGAGWLHRHLYEPFVRELP
jgi:hypothetical protein